MQAQDIMKPVSIVCRSDQSIAEIAGIFLENGIDVLPVLNNKGLVAGIINKKHLYKALRQRTNAATLVNVLMARNVMSVDPEAELQDLYPLSYKKLPVIKDGRILGEISKETVAAYNNFNISNSALQLEAFADAIYIGLIVIDKEHNVVIINKAAEEITGLERSTVLNRSYQEVLPEGNLHSVLENPKLASNQKFTREDKTYLSVNCPIVLGGKAVGALSVMQDISRLEELTDELEYAKRMQAEMDAVLNASSDSIFVTDAKGNVLSVNDAYAKITGINGVELIGKNMYDLVRQGFYDRSATVSVIENHKPVTFTQHLKTGRTMLVTGNPVFNQKGELVKVLTNGRDITELMRLKQEAEQAYHLSKYYEKELKRVTQSGEMIIASEKSREVLDMVRRIGKVNSTVLIYGESGVGKELVAREVYINSFRKDKPLINLNCAAIPENLLESELFGYESGAFSGAKKGGKAGIFEIANGGTLFLDEIGEMPLNLQSKVLRVIQEKEIMRIGGTTPISVDVRLIAATNRDLWEMVRKGQFRQDLYYRLNVVPVYVAPLRDRKEEIPVLVRHFLKIFNEQYGMNKSIDERVMDRLLDYDWPGNIRELRNTIERAVVTSVDEVIKSIKIGNSSQRIQEFKIEEEDTPRIDLKEKVNAFEKDILLHYIKTLKSSRKVAKALGVSQTTIVRKAAQYGITLEG
ncbi:MAG: sigma 54-interacting transcriptional regulator [Syntrophomonadaceae bacterium]|nr:sigma 54-interacting transcriptional regulator [Syntrophomonadaceae bacterium]